MQSKSILIIEDNQDMAQLLALHLRDMQYEVTLCFDGNQGYERVLENDYDLVILDLMLPGKDGLSICKAIRKQSNFTIVLMLTAKDSEFDRVLGLESGADDYVTKPFSLSEVLARVKAIFRRLDAVDQYQPNQKQEIIQRGSMVLDVRKHAVLVDNESVDLTAKEFELLAHFARHPGRVFTRDELLDQVWGYGHDGYEHTVNSHINRLRLKIEKSPKQPIFIQTVWGVGYKFTEKLTHV